MSKFIEDTQLVPSTAALSAAGTILTKLNMKARGVFATNEEKTASEWHCNGPVRAKITKAGQTVWSFGLSGGRISYEQLRRILACDIQRTMDYAARGTWLEMDADVNYVPGHEVHVTLKARVDLKLKGSYRRFGVGAMPRGMSGRQEMGGPMVVGPWAFAFGLSTCITNSKAHQEADAARRATDIEVEEGTRLNIDEVSYVVRVIRGEFLKLEAVAS